MSLETAPRLAPEEIRAIAEQLDRKALIETANVNQRIGAISDEQRKVVTDWAHGRMQGESAPGFTGNDGATVDGSDFPPQPEDTQEEVLQEMEKMQKDRLTEVQGDQDVVVTNEQDNVLGHFDGTDVHLDAQRGITRSTYEHELQHKKDGFIEGVELDEQIAQEIRDEFETNLGVTLDEDDELTSLTARAVLEERATEAGGETPEQYRVDFVDPTHEAEKRMNAAGLNGSTVLEKLVKQNDVEGFRKAVRATIYNETMDNRLN